MKKINTILLMFVVLSFAACAEFTDEAVEAELAIKNGAIASKSAAGYSSITPKGMFPITVRVNGAKMYYSYQQPMFDSSTNRCLVPLNETFTRMGFQVSWNDNTKEAICKKTVSFWGGTKSETLIFKLNSNLVKRIKGTTQPTYHYMGANTQIINSRMMVPVQAFNDYTRVSSAYWDRNQRMVNIINWDELFVGLDWLGTEGSWWKNYQKYIPGEYNPYYDPDKPTIIYIHGWQNGSVAKKYNPDLALYEGQSSGNIYGQNYWIERGWNVGVFRWTQLADENFVWDAESKMWDPNYGDQKMQWRNSWGQFKKTNMPNRSVGKLLYDTVVSALSRQNPNKEVRIIGHSLGTQLATRLSRDLIVSYGTASKFSPKRLTLMDPAAGSQKESYLQSYNNGVKISTGNMTTKYGKWLAGQGLPIELYRTSSLMSAPGSDYMVELEKTACYIRLYPEYTGDPAKKHSMPVVTYFWSYSMTPPGECYYSNGNWVSTGNTAGSASASNWRILNMMGVRNGGKKWVQTHGKSTVDPSDDWFKIENW